MDQLRDPLAGDGGDGDDLAAEFGGDALASLGGVGQVHLGDDQELGPVGQGGAVMLQLLADRPIIGHGVGPVDRGRVDQVDEEPGPFDVAEEFVAQAVAFVGPLDEAGDVGHDEGPIGSGVDRPQVGVLGREGVVGDLGMGARDPRQQGRFARVGQAHEPDVGDDLQLEGDPPLLARDAFFVLSGGAIGARLEEGVAVSASPSAGDDHRITRPLHVAEHVAAVAVADDGPRGDLDDEVLGPSTGAVRALAVLAPVGLEVTLGRQVGEVGEPLDGAHDDVAAIAAVAAVRPAPGYVLLAPEADATVAAVAPSDENRDPVHEHD